MLYKALGSVFRAMQTRYDGTFNASLRIMRPANKQITLQNYDLSKPVLFTIILLPQVLSCDTEHPNIIHSS